MGDVSLNQPINAEPRPGGIAKQGDQILGLMAAGWTNESHSLYISSMEASFMQQLYGHEHHRPDANMSHVGGNGFKVLQEGVSENLRFERNNAHVRDGGIICLPDNPWIRRFRPRNSGINRHCDGVRASVDDGESGTDTVQEGARTHGRELRSCVGENHVDKSTEVSDQNFPDEEVKVDTKPCKKRRSTITAAPNDQATMQENVVNYHRFTK